MKIIELQLFLISLIILIVSFEDIYLNLADIYFQNGNNFELFIALALSILVFIIGHVIVLFNTNFKFKERIFILKCIYVILVMYFCVFLFSDVIEIWANMFFDGIHINELNWKNKNMSFSFILCFFILIFLLLLKNLQFKVTLPTKMENDYE